MDYKSLVLLFALFSAATAEDKKKRGKECTTYNNKSGKCVSLNQCQHINNALGLRNSTAIAEKSFCGNDKETLVCCENPSQVPSYNENINNVLAISHCGTSKETSRIWGGEVSEIGEFPWLVVIEYKYKGRLLNDGVRCVGSLINKEYVLTAAYCLVMENFTPVAVRLAEWNTATDPDCQRLVANTVCAESIEIVGIRETIPHPYFKEKSTYNDIGLIRLEKEVRFTDFVSPICLAHSNLPAPAAGAQMIAAGWGDTENDRKSEILLKTGLPLISREQCRQTLQKMLTVGLSQICAGGVVGKDTCTGDGGTPLMYEHDEKMYQHGISSLGFACGKKYPAVYTNVSDYLPWIANVIINYK